MVAGHVGDRHITLTESSVTVRPRAGAPAEHRAITSPRSWTSSTSWACPLTVDEQERLRHRVAELRTSTAPFTP